MNTEDQQVPESSRPDPSGRTPARVWPCLAYRDPQRAIEFLATAFGFESTVIHEQDGKVVHAEMAWPEGGGVMFGTASEDGSDFQRQPPGGSTVYVVCSNPDELAARASRAGAETVRELTDTDYGSRDCAFRDPEGNLWDFGTYPGTLGADD